MTGTRPPAALEHKSAPAMLEPPPARSASPANPDTGVTAIDEQRGIVEALVAVTGVRDDVNDILEAGCFGRTLRVRTPRLCVGHDWNRVVGRTISAIELLPGDPRLPRIAPDGTRWPREAGALRVKAAYILGTRDGREAYEIAKAFGTSQSFSIGYKVLRARQDELVRRIFDLDVFEYSGVLHGANRLARQLTVKGEAPVIEYKSTASAAAAVRRARLFEPVTCAICGQPAAGTDSGALPSGRRLICLRCVAALDDLAVDGGVITAEQLAEAEAIAAEPEITSEDAYIAALDDEIEFDLEPDGTLARAVDQLSRGRAWR